MATKIEQDLQQQSVGKLLLRYSGPAIIETVCVSLYNIIDSIFIGHNIGPMALAALAIALPLMNLVVAFCTLIATGGASLVSIFMGQKDLRKAMSTVNNVVLLCIVHSLLFGGLMLLFLDPILHLFGATDATIGFARRYMRIILLATPISYLFLGLNNVMRSSGYPKKAMISAMLSVAVNILLCWLFVFRLKLSIEGAALATVCGQTAALIWCIAHFVDKRSVVHFDFSLPWLKWKIVMKSYAIGMAPFLMNCCACIVVVFLNHALLTYGGSKGNLDISAYGILNRVTMVFVMIVSGVTLGMQPILGFNYGANRWGRIKQTLKIALYIGVGITVVGWIITELFPDRISLIFTYDGELINIDRTGFRIYFICYPVVGAAIIIQNFFQFIDRPKYSIILSMTRQLIFLLPFLLIFPKHFGVDGVWGSMAASDMLSFLVSVVLLIIVMRNLDHKYKATGKLS